MKYAVEVTPRYIEAISLVPAFTWGSASIHLPDRINPPQTIACARSDSLQEISTARANMLWKAGHGDIALRCIHTAEECPKTDATYVLQDVSVCVAVALL